MERSRCLRLIPIYARDLDRVWMAAVLGCGVVVSLGLFFILRGWERKELEDRAAGLVREQAERLQISVLRSMEVLHSVAALSAAHGEVSREEFRDFVRPALRRQPELQALSWNPRVTEDCRTALEAAAIADGLDGFQFHELSADGELRPAGRRAEYLPVYLIEPMDRNGVALGYDLNSDRCRRESAERARDTGRPVATAPVRLAQEREGQVGILVLLPVYRGGESRDVEERRERLAGFAVAVFRVADLASGALRALQAKQIEAELFDAAPGSGRICALDAGRASAANSETLRTMPLEVAGRAWELRFRPMPSFGGGAGRQSWLVLLGGLAFTLLATAYLYGGWRRNQEIAGANAALQEEVAVRQQAEAEAAFANQAKSDFLASMSHEIRTPLNAILGYAQLLQRDAHLSSEQRDGLEGINAGGQHLLGLINEILDLSKIEAGRMELNPVSFSLAGLLRGLEYTFKPLCAQKGIRFRVAAGGSPPDGLRGDEGKLRQVLINLLGNAVKFTGAGEVCLRCEAEPDGQWRFEVIDSGLGIPAEEQADIFKPFHQGSGAQHQGGTGLGLAIAQRQVELLGGELKVQSERGIGSRFHFVVPLASVPREIEAPLREVTRLATGCKVRALVVDDRRENREVLGRMLSRIGCEVFEATDGEEAVRTSRAHEPDIIFLDLLLPSLGGATTARALLAEPCGTRAKIVAHTASALSRHRDEAMGAGCVDLSPSRFGASASTNVLAGTSESALTTRNRSTP